MVRLWCTFCGASFEQPDGIPDNPSSIPTPLPLSRVRDLLHLGLPDVAGNNVANGASSHKLGLDVRERHPRKKRRI